MPLSMPNSRRATAIALVAAIALTTFSRLTAADTSTLTGRVLAGNGADPRAGVVVTLVDPATETMYKSSPTDAKGAFSIATAPSGSYALVVEAPEGAFLASGNVKLAPGVNRPVSLALKPGKQGEPPPTTPPATPPATPAAAPPPKQGIPTWAKWVIAGGIVVGAAIVVDAVTSDSNEASHF